MGGEPVTCLGGCDHLSAPHGVCRVHGEALHRLGEGALSSIVCDCPAPNHYARGQVFTAISIERMRQDQVWGEQNHPDGTGGYYAREDAEDAKVLCRDRAKAGTITWRDILDEEVKEAFAESDLDKLRTELLQVAAVAAAWVEAIDRRQKPTVAVTL